MPGRLSRFDNRPFLEERRERWLSSREACERLGVKRSTLYTYVSRGWIQKIVPEGGRAHRYLADDVDRIATKADARRGHRAVAAGALRFGDPVLDSTITEAGPERVRYRGRDVVALIDAEVPFEDVAALLWSTAARRRPWPWPKDDMLRAVPRRQTTFVWRAADQLIELAHAFPTPFHADEARTLRSARRIVRCFAASVAPHAPRAARPESIAGTVCAAFGLHRRAEPAVNAALVSIADHELNVSTFAARVAASGGADLYACMGSALYAFSGYRHGGAAGPLGAFVREVGAPSRAKSAVLNRLRRGRLVPGFGHPLYSGGDPRSPPLLAWAARVDRGSRPLATLMAICDVMRANHAPAPNVDAGLVALAYAFNLPATAASAMFCVGRTAGWTAHILEQRALGTVLRPTARYVGLG